MLKPGAAAGIFKYPTYVQDIMGYKSVVVTIVLYEVWED